MKSLQEELWGWQESIDSPVAAKLLLVRAIGRLNELEAVIAVAEATHIPHHPQCPAFCTPQSNIKCQCSPLTVALAKLRAAEEQK